MTAGGEALRVLAVADEVDDALDAAALRELAPELVLSAGDLPFEYLEFLVSVTNVPLVYVPGNHDPEIGDRRRAFAFDGTFPLGCGAVSAAEERPGGCVNADLRVVEERGVRIAGLGGCVRYREGPNQWTQAQLRRRAAKVRRRSRRGRRPVDVLLTHAPPRGVGDVEGDPAHVGVDALRGLVSALRPGVLVHGHVLPMGSRRADRRMGDTLVVNAAPHRMLSVAPRVAARVPAA